MTKVWPLRSPEEKQLMKRAHSAASYAIRMGRLIRQPCEKCGRTDYLGKVTEAHHHNGYELDHYLDVQWLCPRCHIDTHVSLHHQMMAEARKASAA